MADVEEGNMMLQTQHEDLETEYTKITEQKTKVEEDHRKLTEQHNIEFQQLQQEKNNDIATLRGMCCHGNFHGASVSCGSPMVPTY